MKTTLEVNIQIADKIAAIIKEISAGNAKYKITYPDNVTFFVIYYNDREKDPFFGNFFSNFNACMTRDGLNVNYAFIYDKNL
jgi:hypothetical protein